MGVQRDVGGNPSIPPSSFWAQRSAQPVGVHTDILSKCIRIVIVAFGSAPILAYRCFAHRLRWAATQTRLRDFIPQTPFFASRGFKILNQLNIPTVATKSPSFRMGFCFAYRITAACRCKRRCRRRHTEYGR